MQVVMVMALATAWAAVPASTWVAVLAATLTVVVVLKPSRCCERLVALRKRIRRFI